MCKIRDLTSLENPDWIRARGFLTLAFGLLPSVSACADNCIYYDIAFIPPFSARYHVPGIQNTSFSEMYYDSSG